MNEKQPRLPALGDYNAAKIRNAPPLHLTKEEKEAALQRIELQEQSFDDRMAEVTSAKSRPAPVTRSQQIAAQGFIKLAEQRGQTVAQWVRDVAEAEVTSTGDPNLIKVSPGVWRLRPGAIEEYEDRLIEQKRAAAARGEVVWVPISRRAERADVSQVEPWASMHVTTITRTRHADYWPQRLWRWLRG